MKEEVSFKDLNSWKKRRVIIKPSMVSRRVRSRNATNNLKNYDQESLWLQNCLRRNPSNKGIVLKCCATSFMIRQRDCSINMRILSKIKKETQNYKGKYQNWKMNLKICKNTLTCYRRSWYQLLWLCWIDSKMTMESWMWLLSSSLCRISNTNSRKLNKISTTSTAEDSQTCTIQLAMGIPYLWEIVSPLTFTCHTEVQTQTTATWSQWVMCHRISIRSIQSKHNQIKMSMNWLSRRKMLLTPN